MKKEADNILHVMLNDTQCDFLKAYARTFGGNVSYVASKFIMDGIKNAIETEILRKAKDSFALAKKINQSKDAKP